MKSRNELRYCLSYGLLNTALLMITGSIAQSFMLECGIAENKVTVYVSLTMVMQFLAMLTCAGLVDRIKNIIRAGGWMILMFLPMFLVLIFLCVCTGLPAGTRYTVILIAGCVTCFIYGIWTITFYKLPYHIMDMKRYGSVTAIAGIVVGICGMGLSSVMALSLERGSYYKVMIVFFIAGAVMMAMAGVLQLRMKRVNQISEENVAGKKINLLRYRPFTLLMLPCFFRGFFSGVIALAATIGYYYDIVDEVTTGYLVTISNVVTFIGCYLYAAYSKRRGSGSDKLNLIASVAAIFFTPAMLFGQSKIVFLLFYGITFFAMNITGYAVPVAVTKFVDYEIIGQYSAWRMFLTQMGGAAAGLVCIPMLEHLGGITTLTIAGGMQLIAGVAYYLAEKKWSKREVMKMAQLREIKKIGKQVLFLETKPGNGRNGDAAFIRLKDGGILLAYSEYLTEEKADEGDARISAYISYDEGDTWGNKHVLLEKTEGCLNIGGPSLMRLKDESLAIFYTKIFLNEKGLMLGSEFMRVSEDEGKTWGEETECQKLGGGYIISINDRVVRLKSGRIIFPVAIHGREGYDYLKDDLAPGEVGFCISDDDGKSWHMSPQILHSPFHDAIQLQEPGVYQHEDGKLWMYCRTWYGSQYMAYSEDEGESWTDVEANLFFTSPGTPMHVRKAGKYLLAIFNPEPMYLERNAQETNMTWGRTPLVCAVSTNDGITYDGRSFGKVFYLEDDRNNAYCYPAAFAGEDYFLAAYYHSNNMPGVLNCLKVVKVHYSELEERATVGGVQYAGEGRHCASTGWSGKLENVQVAGGGFARNQE